MGLTRRGFVAGMAAAPLTGRGAPAAERPALRALAAARGLLYGSCVLASQLRSDPDFAALLRRECSILVTENDLKWSFISDVPGQYDFSRADAIADFAAANGMKLRGHALLWYHRTPDWFATLGREAAERALERHIAALVGRYRGRIAVWDVVNEPIHLADGRADGLRRAVFLDALGPDYVARAFALAHDADPDATLLLNEYGIEYDTPEEEAKRTALLRLLERLCRDGVPVGMLGVQAHLDLSSRPFSAARLRRFFAELAALGIAIAITELDVSDATAPADIAARDRLVADAYARFLEAALAEQAVRIVMTWGLSDRHSWIVRGESGDRRRDGLAPRPLPFDAALQPKPAWQSLARAFATAPTR